MYLACKPISDRLSNACKGDIVEEKHGFAEILSGAGWQMDDILEALESADDFYCERLGVVTPEPRYVVTMTYVIGPLFMLIVKQWKVHTYIHIDVKCSVIPELIGFDEVGGGT